MPNQTVLIQWLIFMAALVTLTFGIFKPTLRLLAARRERIQGEEVKAEHYRKEAERLLERVEKKIEEARLVGIREKETRRQEGEKSARSILEEARHEIDQQMRELRQEIEKVSKESLLQLQQYAQDLGRQIASKVLEREF